MSTEGPSLGVAAIDLVVNTDQGNAAIATTKAKVRDFSSDAQAAFSQLSASQKQVTDRLLKQADTWGLTRDKLLLYKAEAAGLPTAVIDELSRRLAQSAGYAQQLAAGVGAIGDSLKGSTFSDSQLYKVNQALADMRTESDAARASMAALAQQQLDDDVRLKAVAAAGAASQNASTPLSARGAASLDPAVRAAQQEQLQAINAVNAARDKAQREALESAAAQKASAAAAQAEAAALADLLGKIDPTVAALARLDEYEAKLRAARASGSIGDADFQTYAATIDQARAKIAGADQAMGGFKLSTAGARRELGVMVGEIAQGNFGNLEGSLATLASRSGLLAAALSPIGLLVLGITASIGVLAAGVIAGAAEEDKLNASIIATGNYAGVTTGQVNAMAVAIGQSTGKIGDARDALQLLIGSGKVTGDQLQIVAQGVVSFSELTGQSIDQAVSKFTELADDPVKSIEKLNDQYHFLSLSQAEHIRALVEEGNAEAASSAAQDAAAAAFTARAADMRAQLGTVEKSWRAVETAAKDAWDGIKNVGRPTSLSDDVAHFNQLADTYKQNLMASFHQTDAQAEQNPVVQANRAKALALQPGADLEKWAADNDAANAKIQQAAIKGSDVMDQYLKAAKADSAKAEEIKKVKDATAALLAADPANKTKYLADQTTALAQIDKKYTNHDAKSADSADEASQVAAFKASLAAMTDAYKNSQAELETARKAGTLSEQDYYKQSDDLLWQNESDQVTAIQAEINRLQTRKAIGAERIKLDSQINQLEAEAAKIEADTISKSDQLADQEKAGVDKRTAAYNAFADALDLTVQNQQRQIDAQVASIGMGDREYQQQQALNKIDADYAKQLQDLAKLKDKPVDAGGLDPDDYQRRVDKINADHAQMVQQQVDGFARINAAREDWENGLTKGYRNWADEATNVAGEVASATTNVFDGFANATVQALNGGKNAWHDFAVSVIEDIEKIAIKLAEQQAVSAILSAFGIGGGSASGYGDALNGGSSYTGSGSLSTSWAGEGGGWSFNAKGGVYDSPSLSAYSGGIYDSPHLFKFASGAGVFGEAGPEAIMPLKRGADGRLGIASSGGSGDIYFTQSISIASDGTSSVDQNTNSEAMRQFGDSMRAVAQGEISRAIQPGGQIWRLRNGSGGR